MKYNIGLSIVLLFNIILFSACDNNKKSSQQTPEKPEKVVNVPVFNADSAYNFVAKQVAFGPRVPNTEAHKNAATYFVNKFQAYGAKVQVQEFEATTFDNQTIQLKNIIASYQPEKTKRILLAAHWDSRPFADKDKDRKFEPIDGANDGASGVGVLLEIARVLSGNQAPEVGIDLILFDGEDWGNGSTTHGDVPLRYGLESWWCLGSQYWSKNKHKAGYSAYYGILLDMVGAKNSQFHMEGESLRYAQGIVEKVWNRAQQVGYGNYFIKSKKAGLIDDHVFINEFAKIPTIDIVHYDPQYGYFGDYHHTHKDNMDIISKETLKAVGETVLNVVYYE